MSICHESLAVLLPAIHSYLQENGAEKTAKSLKKVAEKGASSIEILSACPWDAATQKEMGMPTLIEIVSDSIVSEQKNGELSDKKKKKAEKKLNESRLVASAFLSKAFLEKLSKENADALDFKKTTKSLEKECAEKLAAADETIKALKDLSELYNSYIAKKYGMTDAIGSKKSKKRAREEDGTEKPKKKKVKKIEKTGGTSLAKSLDMTAELAWKPKEVEKPKESEEEIENGKRKRMDPILAREMNRRQDWDKWAEGLEGKDQRLQDGFHRVGDTWGDKAFADLSKVKGKSFVKEMQKKKRASWRGGGIIDMKVNSLIFSDSE